jgi:chemotaxis protein methyltransferase CheR
MAAGDDEPDVEELEMDLLLEAIHRRYDYDFRGYARASLRRRLWHRATLEQLPTLTALQERVLHDASTMQRLLRDLSINVTEMFRDPGFHAALRERVFPALRTHPFVRVWVAGCSTGEEVTSLAIALAEAGLLERSRIYATDIDATVLERAREGAFPLERLRGYTQNYQRSGGSEAFSSYYSVEGEQAVFDRALYRNVVFAQHNLVSDGSFNEFQLVVCRNVMIYFSRPLQDRVLGLFVASMGRFGILGLGRKETLAGTRLEERFEVLDAGEKLYRLRP